VVAKTQKHSYFVALLHLLKRLRSLPFVETKTGWGLEASQLPEEAGTYCLWWRGGNEQWQQQEEFPLKLIRRENQRAIVKECSLPMSLVDVDHHFPVPLFLSKSRSMAPRIKRQLMLDTARIPNVLLGVRGIETQVSHFRLVFDQFFPEVDNPAELIVDNLAYSYVKLEGSDNAFWRFFFTAYAIGVMRPLCNIDIIDTAAASLADDEYHFDRRLVPG